MIAIPNNIVQSAIALYKSDIKIYSDKITGNLKAFSKTLTGKKKKYIDYLIPVAGNLITMSIPSLQKHRKELDKIISPDTMKTKPFIKFKDQILTRLGYEARRSDFYPRYFQSLEIKACIYCNSQLTITSEKTLTKKGVRTVQYKARFQVDHYWAKSEYPAFSVSLYNLYPSCATCNNSKSNDAVDFELYSSLKKIDNSNFKFKLKPGSASKYITSQNLQDIDFTFSGPAAKRGYKSTSETFDIEGIYATQKDIIAELIIKSQVYTASYKKTLAHEFAKLFKHDPNLVDQLIIGNYTQEKNLHKRPMAKFMIDMAKELGLIK